jgi:hypothetical protein
LSAKIAERIEIYPEKNLPCAVAHYIAAELGVPPLEVGKTADEIGKRVSMCQMGLFGYARKGRPAYRIRTPMENVPQDLADAIREASIEGRVSCAALWRIAKEFDLSRLEIGNAVEGLGIKVKPCQLGFF